MSSSDISVRHFPGAHTPTYEVTIPPGGARAFRAWLNVFAPTVTKPIGVAVNGVTLLFMTSQDVRHFAEAFDMTCRIVGAAEEVAARWAVVEIFGKKRHVAEVREGILLGEPFLHLRVIEASGEEHTLVYSAKAIFSIDYLPEEVAKRTLLPYENPCCWFEPSSLVPSRCGRCGNTQAEDEFANAEHRAAPKAKGIKVLIGKLLRVSPYALGITWDDPNPDAEHGPKIVDLKIDGERVTPSVWERVFDAGLPIHTWETAAPAWADDEAPSSGTHVHDSTPPPNF